MHTYVVTADGRTYSAISSVPPSLGAAMQTLNSIGGIIGWLFALPMSAKAKNGYSFTGKQNVQVKDVDTFGNHVCLLCYQRAVNTANYMKEFQILKKE